MGHFSLSASGTPGAAAGPAGSSLEGGDAGLANARSIEKQAGVTPVRK